MLQPNQAFADEVLNLTEQIKLSYGGSFRGSLKTGTEDFSVKDAPDQSLPNQATSAAAYSTDYFSARLGLKLSDMVWFKSRVDYLWQTPIQYNLYPNKFSRRHILLRDLYLQIPLETKKFFILDWKKNI